MSRSNSKSEVDTNLDHSSDKVAEPLYQAQDDHLDEIILLDEPINILLIFDLVFLVRSGDTCVPVKIMRPCNTGRTGSLQTHSLVSDLNHDNLK